MNAALNANERRDGSQSEYLPLTLPVSRSSSNVTKFLQSQIKKHVQRRDSRGWRWSSREGSWMKKYMQRWMLG